MGSVNVKKKKKKKGICLLTGHQKAEENSFKCPCIPDRIPHSINYEETGTSEGLWDHLGRRKMTNTSFFDVFKAPSFALINSASQSNATGFENVENDMFVIFRLPKRSHNSSLLPIST